MTSGDTIAQLVISIPDRDEVSVPVIAVDSVARTGFFGSVLDGLNRLIGGGEAS